MTVELIGYIHHHEWSEAIEPGGPAIDLGHVRDSARVHEEAGFDRVLFAFNSTMPESLMIAQYVASLTERLGLMIAHRAGFNAPTIVARQLATLDHITRGRVAVHVITGASDEELAADGNEISKSERYARTDEFLDIVRQEWTADAPFDYTGRYYRVRRAYSPIKPLQPGGIPVFFGGASKEAIAVAARHADVYAQWGETLGQVEESIATVRAAAATHGRAPRFSLSLLPIIADTEELAWARAEQILERARAIRARSGTIVAGAPHSEGSRRLLAAAEQGDRLDTCLWTGMARLTGARGNSTALVGTPDQVAKAMLAYHRAGVSVFVMRGFDPLSDAQRYGRELLPRVRDLVAAEPHKPPM